MEETKLTGQSLDIVSQNIEKMKQLFPEIITEDKINFEKLEQILGKNIDNSNEKFNFTWFGKSDAIKESQKISNGTLLPCKEKSKNWNITENLYIEGDNLEILKLLQKSYYSKIKMIYIDPPYNTGNDFIYSDDYKDNLQNYIEKDRNGFKISSNPETGGRYHTNWLNMIYPRLKLAKNLLTDDGAIFISIDDHEVENLKKVCDEIFGQNNFVAQLVWEQGRKSMAAQIAINHEYCLIYCKNREINIENNNRIKNNNWKNKKEGLNLIYKTYNDLIKKYNNDYERIESELRIFYKNLPESSPSKKQSHFNCVDEKGIYNPDNISQGTGKGGKFEIIHPKTKKPCKLPKGGWRFSEDKLPNYLENNKIHFGKDETTVPCLKRYLKETEYEVAPSVLYKDGRGASNRLNSLMEAALFPHPKDEDIIKKFINYVTATPNNNDIILDFFAGSSTTAESIFKLNEETKSKRKFILVQIPENLDNSSIAFKKGYNNICDIGEERIRRVGDKIVEESGNKDLDIGFKVFKLDSSNLTKWNSDYDNLEDSLISNADNIIPNRVELDLVYEIMLKYGIDLSVPVEEKEVNDKKIYSVGFGALLICLDNNVTSELAKDIIKVKKDLGSEVTRVVFKDNGFKSDSDKTNIKETLRANNIDEFITI